MLMACSRGLAGEYVVHDYAWLRDYSEGWRTKMTRHERSLYLRYLKYNKSTKNRRQQSTARYDNMVRYQKENDYRTWCTMTGHKEVHKDLFWDYARLDNREYGYILDKKSKRIPKYQKNLNLKLKYNTHTHIHTQIEYMEYMEQIQVDASKKDNIAHRTNLT